MITTDTCAIVPVKSLAEAKSRLATVLSAPARRRLVLAMLDDVLRVLAASAEVGRIIVVTADSNVATAAGAAGAQVVREPTSMGLNTAIRHAMHHAGLRADTRCLILPADVPLVTTEDIANLLRDASEGTQSARVVIAPSHDGGTNALVLDDHDLMGPSFGANSFERHLQLAKALHLQPRVVRLPGLGFDIDTPDDLRRLSQVERYAWLQVEALPSDGTASHRRHAHAGQLE